MGRTYYTPVLNEVKRRAMKARLMPVLAVPLAPTPGAPAAFTVELFDGEDVAAKARQTAEVQRLAPEEVKAVAEAVVRRAVDVGLLPVLSVDIDLEGEGGTRVETEDDVSSVSLLHGKLPELAGRGRLERMRMTNDVLQL